MKVSIIIPAYNEEKYIAKTLKAIASQEIKPFEVIVVDNNSTDKTVSVANKFPGVKVVSCKDPGANAARQAGFIASSGDIIVTLDADCIPFPEWLTIGTKMLKQKKVVAVTGPYDFADQSLLLRAVMDTAQIVVWWPGHILLRSLNHPFTTGGNTFFKRKALEEIGGFDTSIVFHGDDVDTGNRLSKVGKVIYSPLLMVRTSARRFKELGLLNVTKQYMGPAIAKAFNKKIKIEPEHRHPR
jgi:glycosyltransferase involved in cell wall biosynthesis